MRKRVLVVENEATLRDLLEFLLDREGYEVTTVSEGEAAQRFMQQVAVGKTAPFDVVILDLLLPILSGRQLLRWLRRQTQTAKVPVLVLTDLQDDDDIADALDEGADDYVIKPFQPKELHARLRKLLRNSSNAPNANNAQTTKNST